MALAVDVKVLDFGLAKMLDDSDPLGSDMTHQGAIVGTPAYLAPERLGGGMALGPEVDVFSLGVLIYRLVAGKLPFEAHGGSMWELLDAITRCEPAPLASPVGAIPSSLVTLVAQMLARDPQARPTAVEAAAALTALEAPDAQAQLGSYVLEARARRAR